MFGTIHWASYRDKLGRYLMKKELVAEVGTRWGSSGGISYGNIIGKIEGYLLGLSLVTDIVTKIGSSNGRLYGIGYLNPGG